MLMVRSLAATVALAMIAVGAHMAGADDYPNKSIRIVTGAFGGGSDFGARLVAQGVSGPLGQSVIVENRPNNLTAEIAAKGAPDGYTLLYLGSSLWTEPLLRKTAYDPVKDFAAVSIVGRSPQLLYAHASVPVTSVTELIAYAKARPGTLNYSIGGQGGNGHLAAELFKAMAGINIVPIFYSSGSQEIADLLAGRVQLTIGTAPALMESARAGKLKVLGVTTAERSALYPDVPTIASAGLPGYESVSRAAIFVPARTPDVIVGRLNREIVRLINTREAREQFARAGIEAVGSSPEELAAVMKSQMARLGKLIKDIGIKLE